MSGSDTARSRAQEVYALFANMSRADVSKLVDPEIRRWCAGSTDRTAEIGR